MSLIDQALVLTRVAVSRSEDSGFTSKDLLDAFDICNLPRPVKPANALSILGNRGYLTRRKLPGRWWLTPLGHDRSLELLSSVDLASVVAEAGGNPGVTIGGTRHPLLDPAWAPPQLMAPLGEFLRQYPFDTNVFAMTRFPVGEMGGLPDVLQPCVEVIRASCAAHGLALHLASDRSIVDDLWGNVMAHMWGSRYGIAIFEDHFDQGINYNLTIEVGGMLLAGRRTALLRDATVARMPTDLIGQIYRPVDIQAPETLASAIHEWIRDDVGLGTCNICGVDQPSSPSTSD